MNRRTCPASRLMRSWPSRQIDPEDADAKARRDRKCLIKKYNAAVEEQTMVVEEFNAQIRAYKSRSN